MMMMMLLLLLMMMMMMMRAGLFIPGGNSLESRPVGFGRPLGWPMRAERRPPTW